MTVIPTHFEKLARAIERHDEAGVRRELAELDGGLIRGDALMVHYAVEAAALARTPAESGQCARIVRMLLEAGASVAGVDGENSPPLLYHAIDLKLHNICSMILKLRPDAAQVHEADRRISCNDEIFGPVWKHYRAPRNPLHYAISRFGETQHIWEMLPMLQALMHGCGPNSLDRDGATPLQRVLEQMDGRNNLASAQPLLFRTMIIEGADTEALHSESKEPLLIHALRENKPDMIINLLVAGADRNVISNGQSAEDIIRILRQRSLEQGAKSNALQAVDTAHNKIFERRTDIAREKSDLWEQLVEQGRDGVVRLTPFARTLPEREQLMEITRQLPQNDLDAYKWMSDLRMDFNKLAMGYSLDRPQLERLAPLARPKTEVLVEYARGSVTLPELKA